MWKQKNAAFAVAAILAGLGIPSALAQDYNDNSGYYDQFGNGQYGEDSYPGSYGNSGYYDQSGADLYGTAAYDSAGNAGEVSFDYFYDALAPHGQWSRHSRWGDVWRPINVNGDFRPYYQDGYWANTTEYGWTWVSDHAWGDIAFHYGRWVNDPYDGWLWVPGYVWGPSWVIWRSSGDHLGWFPMPPTDSFLLGVEVYDNNWRNWDQSFGYANWYGPSYGLNWSLSQWVFVDQRRFGHRDFRRWVAPRNRVLNLVRNSRNITNYVTENNYISNRSLRGRRFDRGQSYDARPAREVFGRETRRNRADAGTRIHQRERSFNGANPNASARERTAALPRGDGRNVQNRLERRRAGQATQPRTRNSNAATQAPARNQNAAPQRPRRGEATQPPRTRNSNAATQAPTRNRNAAPQRPRRERATQAPRTRNSNAATQVPARNRNAAPRRPRRGEATQPPRTRNSNAATQAPARNRNAASQRPRREQTAQQPRTRQNAAPQRPQRTQRAQPAQRAQRPQRAQTAQRAARAERPQRARAAARASADDDEARTGRPTRNRRNR